MIKQLTNVSSEIMNIPQKFFMVTIKELPDENIGIGGRTMRLINSNTWRYLMNIYETCPVLENEKFEIRLFKNTDCNDLFKVYSDKNALPFFNSDGCDGDNFYYATQERMATAIDFWNMSYKNGWFVRLSIVDKTVESVIGTAELCLRASSDVFNNMGILRVDVRSDYEQEFVLCDIFSLITPEIEGLLGCKGVLTKAPLYAVDRIKAIKKVGFTQSEHLLIGKTGYAYNGYWTIK